MELLLNKEQLMNLRTRISKSKVLSDLNIIIDFIEEKEGLLLVKIDTFKFKYEPMKNQWKLLRALISKSK